MSAPPFSDPSEETRRWLEQAPARLAMLRTQLNEQEQLRAAVRAAEQQTQQLRVALQEQEQLRAAVRTAEEQTQQLRLALQELDQTRAVARAAEQEVQRLRPALQELDQVRAAVRTAEQQNDRLRAAMEVEMQRLRHTMEEQERILSARRAAEQEGQALRTALEQETHRLRTATEEQDRLRERLEASERRGQELTDEVGRLQAESQRYREREGPADSLTTMLSELLVTLRPQLAIAPAGSSGVLTSRFEQALLYATRLHAQRTREGSRVPYVAQPLAAAALVLEDGGDEDQAIGALLYDAARTDTTSSTLEEIRRRFGDRVAAIVQRRGAADVPADPWRVRKERFVEDLRQGPLDVVRVAAADALHAARVILSECRAAGDPPWNRLGVTREDVTWYYGVLVELLRNRGLAALAGELAATADELQTGPRSPSGRGLASPAGARRSFFGLVGLASLGGIFVALAILVWVLFQSTVDMWWEFVRPLLHP